MRRIEYDPAKITYPADWKDKAKKLLQELVDAADGPARQKILSDPNNRIWSELKLELRKLSHGKCWYTEALQAGTDTRCRDSVEKADSDDDHRKERTL